MKASIKSCKYKMWVVWPTVPRIHEWMILSGALLCKYKYQEKITHSPPSLPPIKTTKTVFQILIGFSLCHVYV
jgi:hypothetical protein